jgi:hypothetical protein
MRGLYKDSLRLAIATPNNRFPMPRKGFRMILLEKPFEKTGARNAPQIILEGWEDRVCVVPASFRGVAAVWFLFSWGEEK